MNKEEFLKELKEKLSSFPQLDVEERINFYGEMIDDRIEEGLLEEEAVLAVGTIDELVSQISDSFTGGQAEMDGQTEETPKRKLRAWEIALLALGAPLWIPLLIAAFAIIISVYAVLWSLVAVAWAVELPFFLFSFLSKYLLIGCKKVTKGSWFVTKKCFAYIKNLCMGKKGEQS